VHHAGPERAVQIGPTVADGLIEPLEFPPLSSAVVPGDRVVLAAELRVPGLSAIIAALWPVLESAGVGAGDVCVLQPASLMPTQTRDPRGELPAAVRQTVRWQIHEAAQPEACGYLASSASGERIYLARELLEADFVLPIGVAAFDPILGYRVPGAVLYPGLSNSEAFAKTMGQGHSELRPEDDRPFRQLVDEIVWLLGLQFAIQVVPHRHSGAASAVLAGSLEAVERKTRKLLDRGWRVQRPARADSVVAAISSGNGPTCWDDVGAAVEAAQKLVARGGRIVLLTDLAEAAGPGIELLRTQSSARGALQQLRSQTPPDWRAASRLATAADWASVYLLSRLDAALTEELFLTPLESEQEVQRLLEMTDSCVLLAGAQHTYAEITS
jgi:nickel-dependent lactate racemase